MRQHPWNSTSGGSNRSGWETPVKRFLGDKILGHPTCDVFAVLVHPGSCYKNGCVRRGRGVTIKVEQKKLKWLNLTKIMM